MMKSFKSEGEMYRMVDMHEKLGEYCWMSASCTLDNISSEEAYNNLKNNYSDLLNSFSILRLKFEKINGIDYWKFASENDLKIENLISIVKGNDEDIPEIYDVHLLPHWRLHLSSKDHQTKIRFFGSHSINDARTIFDFLELFCCYAENKPLPEYLSKGKNKFPPLSEFARKNCFKEDISNLQNPKSWFKLQKQRLCPELKDPAYVINESWEFDYEPVKIYNEKNKITIQGILSACHIWAYNKYYDYKFKDLPIAINTPVDTRRLKKSNDEYRNQLFQSNPTVVFPFCYYKNDIKEQIVHCQEELKKALESDEPYEYFNYEGKMVDENTGAQKDYDLFFPDNVNNNIIFASHVGRVPERNNIKFGVNNPINEWGPCLYAFHNNKKILFVLARPNNIDTKFVETIQKTILEYYQYLKNYVNL